MDQGSYSGTIKRYDDKYKKSALQGIENSRLLDKSLIVIAFKRNSQ